MTLDEALAWLEERLAKVRPKETGPNPEEIGHDGRQENTQGSGSQEGREEIAREEVRGSHDN